MKGEMFMKNNKKRSIIIIATTILAITFAIIVFSNCSLKTARGEKGILNSSVSEETVNTDKNDTDAESNANTNNAEVDTAKAADEVNVTEATTVIDNASLSKPAVPNAANNAKNNSNNANSKDKVPTTKNNNQTTPPPATVTQAVQYKAPIGSSKDINPELVKQDILKYMSSLKGVKINSNLNKNNSCWAGYNTSYHLTQEKFKKNIEDSVMIEYRDNVRVNDVGNGYVLEMYIVYDVVTDEYYGENLDYYYFYILSMVVAE